MLETIPSQVIITKELSPADRQAEITYITVPDGVKYDLPTKPLVLLDSKKIDGATKYAFVKMPAYEDGMTIEYSDFPQFDEILEKAHLDSLEARSNRNYISTRLTATLFFDEAKGANQESVIAVGTQIVDRHEFDFNQPLINLLEETYNLNSNDISFLQHSFTPLNHSVCIRELIKHEAANLSQPNINRRSDFYEICPGCSSHNHSEAVTIKTLLDENKLEVINGATAYLYGHWWSCTPCETKMKNAGVNKVIISKNWAKNYLQIKDL